jgi:SulP family sulfate permease
VFIPQSVISLRNYTRSTLVADLIAGLTVGVVALPLALAFAIASGVSPERGIFTAIVAGFIVSALGGSRVQIGGPTGAFVVIVSGIGAKYGYNGLVICMLLAGLLLIAMGLFRFGAMIKFIPFPVVTGFTSGIALIIFSTQIKDLLGLTMAAPPAEFFPKWLAYARAFPTLNGAAAAIGIGTVVLVFVLRRVWPRLPGMLLAMVLCTVLVAVFKLPVETIGSRFGVLPRTLPHPGLPQLSFELIRQMVSPALTVALLAAIESLLSATVADGMIGTRHKSNMELVAQGVANLASAIFGGIPATGAIARTATNIKSGGKTPVAGMIHAATLFLILLVFAPWAGLIPLASLAGILVVIAWQMSEVERFRQLLRAPRSDVMVLVSTFALTVLVDLTVAVQVGVVFAALLFIRRMSEVTNVGMVTREFDDPQDDNHDPNSLRLREVPSGVEVYEINGPFFFGAAEKFKDTMQTMERPPRVLILRLRAVPAIDATGLHVLREFLVRCRHQNVRLILSDVHTQPLFAIQRMGLFEEFGDENITGNLDDALNEARSTLGLPPAAAPQTAMPTVAREKKGVASAV